MLLDNYISLKISVHISLAICMLSTRYSTQALGHIKVEKHEKVIQNFITLL